MNTKIADVLDRARELIPDPKHWCKGRNFHPLLNAYCIRGAVAKAATGDPYGRARVVDDVHDWLIEFAPMGLAYFNDTHEWADVDALLAKAAREARS